jgi:hypothetical protein
MRAAGWLLIVLVMFTVGIGLGVRFSDEWMPTTFTVCPAPEPLATVPPFSLTPAPPGETALQRWRRTKADFERADQVESDAYDQVQRATTSIAIGPYTDAEQALVKEQPQ